MLDPQPNDPDSLSPKPLVVPPPYYSDKSSKMVLRPPINGHLWNFVSWCAITSCALITKMFLRFCAKTTVHNTQPFLKILLDPNRTRPILTVANHMSTLDDPLLWATLPWAIHKSCDTVRWTLGAQEICFTSSFLSYFFSLGQVIPTVRGAGIYQPAMNFALDKLNEGKWVHIFPEGKVNQTSSMIRMKWGVGRLMMEAKNLPIVVPLWHRGFEEVMPEERGDTWIPLPGKEVFVTFGEPIDLKEVLADYHRGKVGETATRIRITDAVFQALNDLQKKAQTLEGGKDAKKLL